MPIAVDFEFGGNCARRPSVADLQREVDAFVRVVEDHFDRPVILYALDDFEDRYHVRSHLGRRLWQRRILHRPNGDRWAMWQITGEARVDGIHGDVDLDILNSVTQHGLVVCRGWRIREFRHTSTGSWCGEVGIWGSFGIPPTALVAARGPDTLPPRCLP